MDIHQLQVFIAVYKNKSFSKASGELNLTQPAVSAHIKKLEEELGVILFDRIGRKTISTKVGDLLFTRSEEVLQKFNEIRRDISVFDETINGLISVGASGIPGSYILPWIASEFKKVHPDVFFQVTIKDSKTIIDKLLGGELLLGIIDKKISDDNLVCMHQIEDELVLAARPGFISKPIISPLRLLKLPLLVQEEDSESRKSMENHHLLHRVSLKALNITAILGSTDSVKEAVKAGLGAAMLSRFVIKDDLKAGLLQEVKIKGIRMKRTFSVFSHRKRTLPKPYKLLVDFIKDSNV